MSHDPALVAETRAWFAKAEAAFSLARRVYEAILDRLPAEVRP